MCIFGGLGLTEHCEILTSDVIEYQIDNLGYIEKSYRPNHKKSINSVSRLMCLQTPISVDNIELVGYHDEDGISYINSCNTFTISGLCTVYKYNNLLDFYAVKMYKNSLQYKLYREYTNIDFEYIHKFIDLFPTSWPAIEFGIGFYPNMDNILDYYFYTDIRNVENIYSVLGMKQPRIPNNVKGAKIAHLGITVKDSNIVKLKRYCHGEDPTLQNWTRINGYDSTYHLYKHSVYSKYLNLITEQI